MLRRRSSANADAADGGTAAAVGGAAAAAAATASPTLDKKSGSKIHKLLAQVMKTAGKSSFKLSTRCVRE